MVLYKSNEKSLPLWWETFYNPFACVVICPDHLGKTMWLYVCLCGNDIIGYQLRPIYGKKVHIYTLLCGSLPRILYTISWLTKFENLNPLPLQSGYLSVCLTGFVVVVVDGVFGFAIYFVFARGYDCWYFFFFSRKFHETLHCFCVIVLRCHPPRKRGMVIPFSSSVKTTCVGQSMYKDEFVSVSCISWMFSVYRWFSF